MNVVRLVYILVYKEVLSVKPSGAVSAAAEAALLAIFKEIVLSASAAVWEAVLEAASAAGAVPTTC